ncbi:hypothetical protein TNCT_43871 [Trichonephila clavata]|uniref:Uncharacterized protein n=1 Tax=Trichonephila clavata TaxID=2740835 RepID=A0A8X6I640_TRICU|nr:hypothetical protein TNCT_43871 [Trichonephila clavata]
MRLIEDFNALPSLCFISASRVIINVWNRREVTHFIDRRIHADNEEIFSRNWKIIEDLVKTFIHRIEGVPPNLLKEMKAMSNLIGIHIMSIRSFAYFAPDSTNSELEFPITYWTAYGTVDIKRHEELLVRFNGADFGLRYNLACNDCFEEIVKELFDLLEVVQREDFLIYDSQRELLSYWTRRQANDLSSFKNSISQDTFVRDHNYSAHQFAFLYTLLTGNKMGIEYFLNFLSPDNYELVAENHAHLIAAEYENRTIYTFFIFLRPNAHFEDAVYLLLSKLDEEKRLQFLRKSPYTFLTMFLRYPFFGIFSACANLLIEDLRWQHISLLLNAIYSLEKLKIPLFDLHLFNDLWRICPESAKADIKTNRENYVWHSERDFLSLLERIKLAERSS